MNSRGWAIVTVCTLVTILAVVWADQKVGLLHACPCTVTPTPAPLQAPVITSVVGENKHFTIFWDDQSPAAYHYQIAWRMLPDGEWDWTHTGRSSRSITVGGLNGATYLVYIRTVSETEAGPWSEPAFATPSLTPTPFPTPQPTFTPTPTPTVIPTPTPQPTVTPAASVSPTPVVAIGVPTPDLVPKSTPMPQLEERSTLRVIPHKLEMDKAWFGKYRPEYGAVLNVKWRPDFDRRSLAAYDIWLRSVTNPDHEWVVTVTAEMMWELGNSIYNARRHWVHIGNLPPHDEYKVRVRWVSADFMSEWSDPVTSFDTVHPTPTPQEALWAEIGDRTPKCWNQRSRIGNNGMLPGLVDGQNNPRSAHVTNKGWFRFYEIPEDPEAADYGFMVRSAYGRGLLVVVNALGEWNVTVQGNAWTWPHQWGHTWNRAWGPQPRGYGHDIKTNVYPKPDIDIGVWRGNTMHIVDSGNLAEDGVPFDLEGANHLMFVMLGVDTYEFYVNSVWVPLELDAEDRESLRSLSDAPYYRGSDFLTASVEVSASWERCVPKLGG